MALKEVAFERKKLFVSLTNRKLSVTNPPARKIGSVADIDPVNEYYGSLTPATNNNHVPQHMQSQPPATNVGVSCFYFSNCCLDF